MTNAFFISALVLGLASNLHCIGMCGPLALTLPLQKASNKISAASLYLLSKAFGYALLGMLSGLLSYSFLLISLQRSFFLALGCMLICLSLLPAVKKYVPIPVFIKRGLHENLTALLQNPSNLRFITGGFLNAFIPCGMILAALAVAAGTGSVGGAAVYMLVFGLAASPGLFALMMFGAHLNSRSKNILKKISAVVIFLMGVFLIWRSFLPAGHIQHSHDIFMQWCFPA